MQEFENGGFTLTENASNGFCPHNAGLRRTKVKTQLSQGSLDLFLRKEDSVKKISWSSWKTRSGKSRGYRDTIVLEKLRFQNVFRPYENRRKAGGFKLLWYEECHGVSWRISVTD